MRLVVHCLYLYCRVSVIIIEVPSIIQTFLFEPEKEDEQQQWFIDFSKTHENNLKNLALIIHAVILILTIWW